VNVIFDKLATFQWSSLAFFFKTPVWNSRTDIGLRFQIDCPVVVERALCKSIPQLWRSETCSSISWILRIRWESQSVKWQSGRLDRNWYFFQSIICLLPPMHVCGKSLSAVQLVSRVFVGYFVKMEIFHILGTFRFTPCSLKCKQVLDFRPYGLKSVPVLENEWKNGGRILPF